MGEGKAVMDFIRGQRDKRLPGDTVDWQGEVLGVEQIIERRTTAVLFNEVNKQAVETWVKQGLEGMVLCAFGRGRSWVVADKLTEKGGVPAVFLLDGLEGLRKLDKSMRKGVDEGLRLVPKLLVIVDLVSQEIYQEEIQALREIRGDKIEVYRSVRACLEFYGIKD